MDRFDLAQEELWSSEDFPEVAAWLKSNGPALEIVEQASRRERFWSPIVLPAGKNGLLDRGVDHQISILGEVWRALMARTMLKLHDGDAAGAMADVLTLERLGSLLGQGPDVVTIVVGQAIQDASCRTFERVLQQPGIPVDQLRRWSADYLASPPI